jgi:hypothetical protein
MAGVSTNFGWNYVNSGADPVSGPSNFAHVQQIDTTLGRVVGPQRSVVFGSRRVVPTGGTGEAAIKQYAITYPALTGSFFTCFLRSGTSRPDSVSPSTALNVTATGFDLFAYRANSTTAYTVYWVVFGITTYAAGSDV